MAAENDKKNIFMIVSLDHQHGHDFVLKGFPAAVCKDDTSRFHFSLSNKYYTACVEIQLHEAHALQAQRYSSLESAHALLLLYSPASPASLEMVRAFSAHMDAQDFRPEVLLVAHGEPPGSGEDLGRYCAEEGIEHLELYSAPGEGRAGEEENQEGVSENENAEGARSGEKGRRVTHQGEGEKEDDDDDDDGGFLMPETQGIDRLLEALHSTIWPDIESPSKNKAVFSSHDDDVINNNNNNNNNKKDDDEDDDDLGFPNEIMMNLEKLLTALSLQKNDEAGQDHDDSSPEASQFSENVESSQDPFAESFRLMQILREQGAALPHSERQRLATVITLAFAKSMMGEEETDSDDDSDD